MTPMWPRIAVRMGRFPGAPCSNWVRTWSCGGSIAGTAQPRPGLRFSEARRLKDNLRDIRWRSWNSPGPAITHQLDTPAQCGEHGSLNSRRQRHRASSTDRFTHLCKSFGEAGRTVRRQASRKFSSLSPLRGRFCGIGPGVRGEERCRSRSMKNLLCPRKR